MVPVPPSMVLAEFPELKQLSPFESRDADDRKRECRIPFRLRAPSRLDPGVPPFSGRLLIEFGWRGTDQIVPVSWESWCQM